MARPKLPTTKRRGELVNVYLRPTERQLLQNVVAASVEFESMSAVLREGFLAGVQRRQPRWAGERGQESE